MTKKHLNLYVEEDVVKVAKSEKINLSALLTNAVTKMVNDKSFTERSGSLCDIQATLQTQYFLK